MFLISTIRPFFVYKNCLRTKQKNFFYSLHQRNYYKVAIVGSGPAGFYAAQYLLKYKKVLVDIYEKFPVPFGLVRYGVAPDHPEVKNVINSFTNTALSGKVSFFGNVSIGDDLTLAELKKFYNAVVLCYGSAQDKFLNIEGENLTNVLSAKRFVGWYNGVPQDKSLAVNLNTDTAVIIGHGNVALDVARILLASRDKVLKKTDITKHSYETLQNSKINKVYIVGRRGPLQAAFTIKEFREITKLENCKTVIDLKDVEHITEDILNSLSRPRKRLSELLLKTAEIGQNGANSCHIKFFRSPLEIKADEVKCVKSVVFAKTELEGKISDADAKVKHTNDIEVLNCGLVIRSIGYRGVPLDPSLPFNDKTGVISNLNGRVIGTTNLYCCGWIATGASGVILGTMNHSFEVAKNILSDIENGCLGDPDKEGNEMIKKQLLAKNVDFVQFSDWQKIDQWERKLGEVLGKPREKLVDMKELIEAAKQKL